MHDYLVELFESIKELLLYIPRIIWAEIVNALISVLDSLFAVCTVCNPSNLSTDIQNLIGSLGGGMLWFLSWFNLEYAVTIIAGSYFIRFLIRRLPFIG